MSKRKTNNITLVRNGILTEQAIIAYRQGDLSAEQRTQMDKFLADDPFAAEALEGLQNAAPSSLPHTFTDLRKRVNDKVGIETKEEFKIPVTFWRYTAAAAALLLLIGVGFLVNYFIQQSDHQSIAMKEQSHAVIDSSTHLANRITPKPDTVLSKTTKTDTVLNQVTVADSTSLTNNAVSAEKQTTAASSSGAADAAPTAMNMEAAPSKSIQATAQQLKENASKDNKSTAASTKEQGNNQQAISLNRAAAPATNELLAKKDKSVSDDDTPALLSVAMDNFNSGEFNTSGLLFDKVLARQSDNLDALFYGGLAQYNLGRFTKSINYFEKVIQRNARYADGGRWYKAQALIHKNNLNDAKPILRQLIQSGGAYRDRATVQLKEIE